MRSLSLVVITVLMTVLSHAQDVSDNFIRPLPSPAKAVVDFARLLSKQQFNTLAKDLKAYRQQTSNAIVVLTLESLTDPETDVEYSLESAATAYFNSWGIGDSVKNNGVLILVVPSLRKVRIEVGLGLEHILTNDECAQIIKEQIVPPFRERQYYQGLVEAVAAVKRVLANPVTAQDDSAEMASEPASYATPSPSNEPSFVTVESSTDYTGAFGTLVVLVIVGGIGYSIYNRATGEGGWYSGGGYHQYSSDRQSDDWPDDDDRHRFSSSSSFSSSDDSSSSSSSDSYSGGSSSGGGASGSW